ncbi:DNA-3-methyladenine glycosylase I [Candidatus Gracilibacteria bacterium]|nr:DNA-3-methyladenine glycosylase I [Candidatus Gracilibacteria bacterium]
MKDFQKTIEIAEDRKGGAAALKSLLPRALSAKELAKIPDHRFLAMMTRGIFNAGFAWKVIDVKWPDFETVFLGFDPLRLAALSPEVWEGFGSDKRVVRNMQKILAVKENVFFMLEIAEEYGSFAKFIAQWPSDDLVGLLSFLKKRGSRLGGMTGQYFLRRMGKDSFLLSRDVTQALRNAGVDVPEIVSSKRDLKLVQETFNKWHQETGLSYSNLSRVLGYSAGINHEHVRLQSEMKRFAL